MNARTLVRIGAVALGLLTMAGSTAVAQGTLAWDKTFPQSARVDHQKVSFVNRLGISLVKFGMTWPLEPEGVRGVFVEDPLHALDRAVGAARLPDAPPDADARLPAAPRLQHPAPRPLRPRRREGPARGGRCLRGWRSPS